MNDEKKITTVIVGINDWDRFTLPALNSIYKQEPNANVICIDNGSNPPYPNRPDIYRSEKTISYSESLNKGISLSPSTDWYILINNDVRFEKPFVKRISNLNPKKIYGFWTHSVFGRPYITGWCFITPVDVIKKIGFFDEKFKPLWYEDADFTFRAIDAGFKMVIMDRNDWGIIHLASKRDEERKVYRGKYKPLYEKNKLYLKRKHGL